MFKRAAAPLAGERAQPADSSSIDGEHEVLEQARHGDVRAWALVVRQHQETVYRVVVLLLGDRITATEVTRTAFIRAFRALPDLAPGTPVRAWLIGIASTIGRAQRRALARAVDRDTKPRIMPLDPRLPPTALPATAQAASLDPDRREDVLAAFDVLSWEERLAIAARYLVGSNRTEAAALLGAELIAVERSLAAALDHVRSALPDARLASLPPDHLGALVTATVVGQLAWTPNLAPSVADRLVRDAIAYPEQFGSSRRVSTEVDVHRRRRGPLVAGRA